VVEAMRGSGFMYFTFTGNDAACAAGTEVLQILRREHLVQRSADMGVVLEHRLRAELGDHPAVVEIRGRGLFFGIELRCNRDDVMMAALERDMWVYPAGSGPVSDAVMVAPPFVVTEAEIDEIVTRLGAAIDSVMPA
jgi:adenosylmethionine-8-amino-7-oxononanoate aminotransferase